MSYSIESLLDPEACEGVIDAVNAFVDSAYTRANAETRKAYVYEYAVDMEVFAFALHWPGSERTRHLPGFELDELPEPLPRITREVCERMGVVRGRVLFNISRYPEGCLSVRPHHDGELFEFDVYDDDASVVHSGLRPPEVALLTLRNDTDGVGTTLHDDEGKVIETRAAVGDLLRFDNLRYQHGVPDAGHRPAAERATGPPRWIRYAIGWRAFEQDCLFWEDDGPLRRVSLEEAVAAEEQFLATRWPSQLEDTLARGHFPFRSDCV